LREKVGRETAEAKAELAALITRYEADPSGFGREAITTALLELTLNRFLKDKIDVEIFRSAFQQALFKAEKSPPMRIVDTDNE
jgi:hypothetical protein